MKVAFLDRDGVINRKAEEHHYITKKEDFIFNEGIFEVAKVLLGNGFNLIVITNQRGIARGIYSEEDLKSIHDFMIEGFNSNGISILDIFYCPHNSGECECRKPKPGMLKAACEKYNIDLATSVLMGKVFGVGKNILVPSELEMIEGD
jgi:D-glycero-D-manno-heptose 1,7-bisphosphate phosphatase